MWPRRAVSVALTALAIILIVGAATFGVYELNMGAASSSMQNRQTTSSPPLNSTNTSSSAPNSTSEPSSNYTISTPALSTTESGGTFTIVNGTTFSPTSQGCSVWFGDTTRDSAIFIPADTLIWIQMVYPVNFTATVAGQFGLLEYPATPDTNITLGVYSTNGTLVENELFSTQAGTLTGGYGQSQNGTLNEVISLPSYSGTATIPVFASLALSQGEHFTVAMISDEPVWVLGSESAQPTWTIPQTYEAAPGQFTTLPTSLPLASLTLPYHLLVQGSVQWNCPT